VLLLYTDGYALADRRTGSHFFVYGLVDWSCYIDFRFMDWLELSIIVKMLCPDEKLASFEVLALTLQRETPLCVRFPVEDVHDVLTHKIAIFFF